MRTEKGPEDRFPACIVRTCAKGTAFAPMQMSPFFWYYFIMSEITATARMLIRRPASEVFEAFADPDIMTKFWFPKASGRLEKGKDVTWYAGVDDDAPEITVHVKSAEKPHSLHIEWGHGAQFTTVKWQFECKGDEGTIVRIIESGFSGDPSEIVQAALDSTGGFNQVVTAAKALLEHDAQINVVKDHVA